jgi:hypothetical protein
MQLTPEIVINECSLVNKMLREIGDTFTNLKEIHPDGGQERAADDEMLQWVQEGLDAIHSVEESVKSGVSDLTPYAEFIGGLESDIRDVRDRLVSRIELLKQMGAAQ